MDLVTVTTKKDNKPVVCRGENCNSKVFKPYEKSNIKYLCHECNTLHNFGHGLTYKKHSVRASTIKKYDLDDHIKTTAKIERPISHAPLYSNPFSSEIEKEKIEISMKGRQSGKTHKMYNDNLRYLIDSNNALVEFAKIQREHNENFLKQNKILTNEISELKEEIALLKKSNSNLLVTLARPDMTRKELNAYAKIYDIKRRWFGLETNNMLRKRILEYLKIN